MQLGYYIVNYDEDNWKSIISSVDTLPANTAAQLIGDSMDLARANLLDYNIPLSLIERAIRSDRLIMKLPFTTALDRLGYLEDMLYTTSAYEKFQVLTHLLNFFFNFAYFLVLIDVFVKSVRLCFYEC